jgi:hypothetical protein
MIGVGVDSPTIAIQETRTGGAPPPPASRFVRGANPFVRGAGNDFVRT